MATLFIAILVSLFICYSSAMNQSLQEEAGCGICLKLIDLVFVVDISSSIDDTEMAQMRNALLSIVRGFSFGPDSAQMGIVQYYSRSFMVLPLVQGTSLAITEAAIANVGNDPARSGTGTSAGLRMGANDVITGRPGAYKVIITATDGRANTLPDGTRCDQTNPDVGPLGCNFDLKDAVAYAHSVIPGNLEALFSLGIGDAIDQEELLVLADGNPDRVTFVDTFANLQKFVQQIIDDVCAALPGEPCTNSPTAAPTAAPTRSPTSAPTAAPTSLAPTTAPTSLAPTKAPTPPTEAPTGAPTPPTEAPTGEPTFAPTGEPTAPTDAPTPRPSRAPTPPTEAPTEGPTFACLCEDNNLCTTDICDQTTGLCSWEPVVCQQTEGNCTFVDCEASNGTCTNHTDICGALVAPNAGAIAGGVVGGLVGLAALGAAALAAFANANGGLISSASSGAGFGSDASVISSSIFEGASQSGSNPLANGEAYHDLL